MPETSSIGLGHSDRLPVTQTLSRETGETILIGLENSFGCILLKYCPIDVCKDLDHSALGCFVRDDQDCHQRGHLGYND